MFTALAAMCDILSFTLDVCKLSVPLLWRGWGFFYRTRRTKRKRGERTALREAEWLYLALDDARFYVTDTDDASLERIYAYLWTIHNELYKIRERQILLNSVDTKELEMLLTKIGNCYGTEFLDALHGFVSRTNVDQHLLNRARGILERRKEKGN